MWQRLLPCAFPGSAWADRHCHSPTEENHVGSGNVFNRPEEEEQEEEDDYYDDDCDDDSKRDDDQTATGEDDDRDGRNRSDDEPGNDGTGNQGNQGDDTTTTTTEATPQQDSVTTESTTAAPSPGPAYLKLPACVTNAAGQFFVSEAAKHDLVTGSTALVSFAYQVQGIQQLNVETLRAAVLPVLERALSQALVPALFAPDACRLTPQQELQQAQTQSNGSDNMAATSGRVPTTEASVETYAFTPLTDNDDNDNNNTGGGGIRFRGLQSRASRNSQDGPVTGMQPIPDDVLLPNYEGVRCRTQLVDEADRCFILTGAFSISGPRNVDWAVHKAQQATEAVMNQQRALDNAHPLVRHVMYLDDINPDEQPWLFDRDAPPVLVDPPVSDSNERITTTWSLVVVGGVLLLLVTVATLLWQRRRRNQGSYDDDDNHHHHNNSNRCLLRRRQQPNRITRGYLAYPSPETDHKQRSSLWLAETPVNPDNESNDWTEINEEPVSSFDTGPMAVSSSLSSSGQQQQQQQHATFDPLALPPAAEPLYFNHHDQQNLWQVDDGSFPSSGVYNTSSSILQVPPTESVVDHDDNDVVSFGSFHDDDDDEDDKHWRQQQQLDPSSPERAWIRDLV